jgi:hypothetical protein
MKLYTKFWMKNCFPTSFRGLQSHPNANNWRPWHCWIKVTTLILVNAPISDNEPLSYILQDKCS